MQPVSACLAIDYGSACTQAVLCRADGSWLPVVLDGERLDMSSAVHTGPEGPVLVGEAAWRRAADDPAGFVLSPPALRAAGAESVAIAGRDVLLVELAAATLRHVAQRAAELAGGPVDDVRLVVAAGWGPKRQQWLRQAARQAGLGMPRLISAPVAAGQRLLSPEPVQLLVPVGSFLLIGDLGGGAEMSVLRRGPHGLEILSTIADPHASAAQADTRLMEALTVPQGPTGGPSAQTGLGQPELGPPAAEGASPGVPGEWVRLAAARAAREALSQQATVTVAAPPDPPMVVHHQLAEQTAAPVWAAAGELAVKAVQAAELTADQLTAIYLVGGASATPAAATAVAIHLGATPAGVQQPSFTAVLGAADASNNHPTAVPSPVSPPVTRSPAAITAVPQERRLPPLRRMAGMALPGLAALLLWVHMVNTADFHNGDPQYPGINYWVWAAWGELATTGVLMVITCLSLAGVFATMLAGRLPHDPADAGPVVLAAVCGLAVCGMTGIITTAVFNVHSPGQPLRWAVLPAVPVAVVAVVLACLAYRRSQIPAGGWDAFFAFPVSALVLIGAGTPLVAQWDTNSVPSWFPPLAQTGAAMIGVGFACVLFRHLALRVAAGVFLAVFGFVVMNPQVFGVVFAVAVAARLGFQARLLYTAAGPAPSPMTPAQVYRP